jgi:hypothetical protein
VFEELSGRIYGGLELEHSASGRAARASAVRRAGPAGGDASRRQAARDEPTSSGRCGSLRYRRSSRAQVERVPELQFQRPEREVGCRGRRRPARDRDRRPVSLRSNGTSVELRARVDRKLVEGVARVADEHAADLHLDVEVVRA